MRPDYQSVILKIVPDRCEPALDVGCGDGALARRLRTLASAVEGIDKDRRSIEKAPAHPDADDIAYHHSDSLTCPFAAESFDLITAVASVHHMDAQVALQRMRRLLRPGGCLALGGLARGDSPVDWAISAPATIGAALHRFATVAGRTCRAPDE